MKKLFNACLLAGTFAVLSAPVMADETVMPEQAVEQVQQNLSAAPLSKEKIKSIQEKLNNEGFELEVDGNLSPGLAAALSEYQQAHDLEVTGEVNAETLAKLNIGAN